MIFSKLIQLCDHHESVLERTLPSPPKSSSCPFAVNPHSHWLLARKSLIVFVFRDLPLLEITCHTIGCLDLVYWGLPTPQTVSVVHSFIAENYFAVCIYGIFCFPNHQLINSWLVFSIMNNTGRNIHKKVFVWTCFYLSCSYLWVDMVSHTVSLFLTFYVLPTFPKWLQHFTMPPAIYKDSSFFTSLSMLGIVCLFDYSYSSGCTVVSHSWMANDTENLFSWFLAWGYTYSEMSIRMFRACFKTVLFF